jgi:hypothetical protein
MTSFATHIPRSSGFHRAREKKQCARSCGQARDRPAPVSTPHTVRFPDCARKPQASPVNVRNDGAVNSGETTAGSVISDAGTAELRPGASARTRFMTGGGHGPRQPRRPSWTACANARPADPQRRHPADHRPCHGGLAPPRRAPRPLPRAVMLCRRAAARAPRAHPDPPPALPGLRRRLGHRDLQGQHRPVQRKRAPRRLRRRHRDAGTRDRRDLHPLRRPQNRELTRRDSVRLPPVQPSCHLDDRNGCPPVRGSCLFPPEGDAGMARSVAS